MHKIITDIFHNTDDFFNGLYSDDVHLTYIADELDVLEDRIKKEIPKEHHSLLEECEKAVRAMMKHNSEMDFLAGYRFGVRMILAAWPKE